MAPGVSVSSMLSVPVAVEGFVFGVHLYAEEPLPVSPGAFSTEQDTVPAVFSVALYFTAVNGSPDTPKASP